MKQAILFLALFISAVSFGQQKVTAPLVRNAPTDTTYAILADTLLYGGHQFVNDTLVRNAIPIAARKKGMWVTVANTGVTYKLSDNLGSWGIVSFGTDSSVFATLFKVRQDSLALASATAAKPSYGDVRDIVSDSVMVKVNKWERWTDTFFIQKYDTSKTALTIRVDTNLTSKPTFQILDSINRVLFEMRALPIKFGSENMMFGVGTGSKIRPIFYDSPTYGMSMGGGGNVGFGPHVLEELIDGNENTAMGIYALQKLIGANGGDPNLVGSLNTGTGSWTLRDLTTGIANSVFGQKGFNGLTTGSYNTGGGKSVGEGLTTGGWHTLLGSEVGKFMAPDAVFDTWIGQGAGKYNKGSYSILLGAGSASRYNTNNELVAGDSDLTAINDWWSGKGKFSGSPTNWTIHGTRGWGTNIKGGDISIAAGEMSGIGASGVINLQVSKSISSGTQQGFLINAATVVSLPNSSFGAIGINTTTPTNALTVLHPQTNRTINDTVALISNRGSSYIVAGGAKSSIGLQVEGRSTNASGTGVLTNTALRAKAVNGNINIAAAFDSGNVIIGDTTTTFRFEVKGGVSNFGSRIQGTTLRLNKDSLSAVQSNAVIVQMDTTTGALVRLGDTVKVGSSTNTGKISMKITNSSGSSLISRISGATVINGGNYDANSQQFLIFDNNTNNTLEMVNSVVGSKRHYIGGINPYIGGSVLQVNGSTVIGGAGTNYFAPTNGLTVWGKTLIGSNTDANTGQLQVTGNASVTGVIKYSLAILSANANITASNTNITGGSTYTLPDATTNTGVEYTVINSTSGSITINTTSAQLIGNFTTATTFSISSNASNTFLSNGGKWLLK